MGVGSFGVFDLFLAFEVFEDPDVGPDFFEDSAKSDSSQVTRWKKNKQSIAHSNECYE